MHFPVPGTNAAGPRTFDHWISLAEEEGFAPALLVGLAGCDYGCAFCEARPRWERSAGAPLGRAEMAALCARAVAAGCRTVQLTGGEPALHLEALVDVLPERPPLPLVLNTNLSRDLSLRPALLAPFHAIIASLKFGSDRCAVRLGGPADYAARTRGNLAALRRLGVPLIVRHLLLPGHLRCCLEPTVAWMAQTLPGVRLSLLAGYLPPATAEAAPELLHAPTAADVEVALAIVREAGVDFEVSGNQRPHRVRGGPMAIAPQAGEEVSLVIDAEGRIRVAAWNPGAEELLAPLAAVPTEEES
jgi:putative pyruvate formate lyase activating enzyme